jgi:hypothetical protein
LARSTIPSNSLASVYGLLSDCATERVLGPDVDIEIDAFDECNTVTDVKGTIAQIRAAGAGFVKARRLLFSADRTIRRWPGCPLCHNRIKSCSLFND